MYSCIGAEAPGSADDGALQELQVSGYFVDERHGGRADSKHGAAVGGDLRPSCVDDHVGGDAGVLAPLLHLQKDLLRLSFHSDLCRAHVLLHAAMKQGRGAAPPQLNALDTTPFRRVRLYCCNYQAVSVPMRPKPICQHDANETMTA